MDKYTSAFTSKPLAKGLTASIVVLFLITNSLLAYAAKIEEYGKLPAINNMAVSPNGNILAFRKTNEKEDIIMVYSKTEKKVLAAVNIAEIDPNDLFFHNDETLILVASTYRKLFNYRHAFDISTAYSFKFKENKVEPLIKLGEKLSKNRLVHLGQSGVGRIVGKSPDNELLYMPAYVGDSDYDNSPNYALLQVRSDGKRRPKVVSRGTPHIRDYFMDDQGNVLARESISEKDNIHKLQVLRDKKWVTIYELESEIPTHSFIGLTADFKKIVFLVIEHDSDRNAYFTMSLKDGNVEKLPYDREDADIERIIIDRNRVALGISYSGLTPSYKLFNKNIQSKIDTILKHFPEESVHLISWSKDWENILVKVEGSNQAGDYYHTTGDGKPNFIASSFPGLTLADIHPIGTIGYRARDGRRIPTIVTIPRPNIDNMKNLPAVIMPHGGPAAYDQIGFDFMAQALAAKGFFVIQPQFRGSTGFGYEHEIAGHGEWGKKMQDDITDAVKFFIKKGTIDKNRVCIAGASYGGYAALAGAAFTPDLYKCAVSIAGVSHIPKVLSSDKSRYGKHSAVLSYLKKTVGGGEFNKKELKAISPYTHADKVKTPVLLIHGADDTVVEYNQSKIMYTALKKNKVETKLVKLKGEDHYLRDGETRLKALKEMVSFIDQQIGNK